MKKLRGILSVIILICGNNLIAQQTNHPIVIKFAPAGLAAGKITFGGEYNFKHRNSITFLAGVPFDKIQSVPLNGKNSDITSKAFSLMAGYRYYLGKKTMNGFYVEPYVRYLKHEASGLLNAELQGQHAIFDTHTKYEGMGAGAQLGFQLMIAKVVVFDLFLIGPEANSAKFSSLSVDITNNIGWSYADAQEAEKQIRDALEDIPVVGHKVDVKVDTEKKSVATNYSGFLPAFRIGASIGIRF